MSYFFHGCVLGLSENFEASAYDLAILHPTPPKSLTLFPFSPIIIHAIIGGA